jgi:hypothetical protein
MEENVRAINAKRVGEQKAAKEGTMFAGLQKPTTLIVIFTTIDDGFRR